MSTALYRRYRPETFAEVIGQEHVTGPLMQALRTGRVNHAYLFSGPRGCGKTTSARILARTLNCHQNTPEHPIDTPCGECPSCVDLARGGSGSLDVVEIDAASHGGVDDARELRERATFAPSRDRYKVFIIDEAHMVSPAGFNALLKIVEEPPEHVRFIFATTEPDKVIGTIRSRTHHYPFRLVPPDVLIPYLDELCRAEGVEVGSGVLPLVVRAGGGSVRDTLSVLDQLIAGADEAPGSGESGERRRVLDYEQAVALLGYTHAALLDDVVGALAARDGASMFRVVERVIESGHEPRRFVEDLLERLRDLVVLAVADGEAVAALGDLPADQLDRMRSQSTALGLGELSRAADLSNAALTEMTGATSPRLHLELLCARLLLPGADDGAAGFGARLDRLERGWVGGGGGSVPASRRVEEPAPEPEPVPVARPVTPPADEPVDDVVEPADTPAADTSPEPVPVPAPDPVTPAPALAPAPAAAQAGSNVAHVESELIRRRWDEVLETLKSSRSAWSLVAPNATVASLDGNVLTLSFSTPGLRGSFQGAKVEAVEKAVYETLGFPVKVSAVVGGAPAPAARPRAEHRQATQDDDGGADAPGDRAAASSDLPDGPAAEPAGVGDAAAADQRAVSAPAPSSARSDAVSAADAAWLAGAPRPAPGVPGTPVPSSPADDGDAEPPGASDAVDADLSSADTSNAHGSADAVAVGSVPRGESPAPTSAAEVAVADASPAAASPSAASTAQPETDGAAGAEGATGEAPRAAAPARSDADARPAPADPAFYDDIPVAEPPDDGPFPDDGGSWAPRGASAAGGRPPARPTAPPSSSPATAAAPAPALTGAAAARAAATAPRPQTAAPAAARPAPAPAPDDDGPPWDDDAAPGPRAQGGRGPGRSGNGAPGGAAPLNLVGPALVAQLLGGTVIDEIVEHRE